MLKASNPAGDFFGGAVAVSGDIIVVGASQEDSSATGVNGNQYVDAAENSGAAYVFVRNDWAWRQEAYLKAFNSRAGDQFGRAVAVSGETVVVGAPFEDGSHWTYQDSGAAHVFVRDGTNWLVRDYLKAAYVDGFDTFGWSVALSGDTLVVGAPGEASDFRGVNLGQGNNSAPGAGAGFVFVRSGPVWKQQAYLKASNADTGHSLGSAVAAAGDWVVLGAPRERSSATGVNGNPMDSSMPNAGAAYAFVRAGTNWSQQAYLKASNTTPNNHFGFSVGAAGDTAVMGAYLENSLATGINGVQTTGDAPTSGAAYVFAGLGPPRPRIDFAPDGSTGYFVRFTGTPAATYRLQRGSSVKGLWETIATLTAPASGAVEFHDASPLPGQAFYRTAQP